MVLRIDHKFKSLGEVVKDYLVRYADRMTHHHDPVVSFAASQKTLRNTIIVACGGRDATGRMFGQQSCIEKSATDALACRLIARMDDIDTANDFDALHDIVEAEAQHVRRIGILTTYNVAMRIGGRYNFTPSRYLYLHAGPAQAWKRLTGQKAPVRVAWECVPPALRKLPPHKLEDLLCEYREILGPELL